MYLQLSRYEDTNIIKWYNVARDVVKNRGAKKEKKMQELNHIYKRYFQ